MELKTIGVLGKDAGFGAGASSLTECEPHLNDATVDVAPIRPKKVYVVPESTLKLRKAKSRAGNKGAEIATTERRKTTGIDETDYSIVPGVGIRHIVETCSEFPLREKATLRTRDPLRGLGCLAANDPNCEAP